VTEPDAVDLEVLLSQFEPVERAIQAASFGGVASHYERFRPGPPMAAIDWVLPAPVSTAIDLGAGTGASSRPLLDRAAEVIAVEPDDRMLAVLVEEVPGVTALKGRGESIPLPDRCADAVVTSSAWHWMDPVPTLREVGRVLVPGGTFGVLWTEPDPEGSLISQAKAILAENQGRAGGVAESHSGLSGILTGQAYRSLLTPVEIPLGIPFDQPEHKVFTWDIALNADELIGLLGTWPWIISLPEETRDMVITEVRRLLGELLGIEGEVTVEVTFRSDAWRCHRR